MARPSALLLALLCGAAPLGAQVTATAKSITVQVTTTQPWADSGLDLQSGDIVEISATAPQPTASGTPACDPKGLAGTSADTATLPLPTAAPGALLARLDAQGAVPMLVGASIELHIEEASHLYLGMNFSGAATCQGELSATVSITPKSSSAADAPAASRGQQLKSQLSTAAQVFMSGQFGISKPAADTSNATSSGSNATDASPAATVLKLSDAPLDSQLRQNIDSLPRRVNDQFQNLGDMVNFVIVGSKQDVQAALTAASWHVADTNNEGAVVNAILQTYDKKDYLAMPMSALFLFGRRQDFGYELAEPIAMVASRHHFRIWKAPFTWQGHEVWCGAGTHDIGFAKDKRNGSVTHKIDPAVDGERDNIGSTLQKASKAKTLTYYLPKDAVQDARNATGDGYHSDGKVLVIFLQ
jgi:hypothetical protein